MKVRSKLVLLNLSRPESSVQTLPADQKIPAAREEQEGVVLAGIKVGFQHPHLVRLHRVLPRVAALQPVAVDSEF